MDEKKKLTDDDYVAKVDELLKLGEDWTMRKQILINLNYYVSNQWIGWDNSAKTVRALPPIDGQERITHNVIQPRVMTKLAKQTKNRIKYDVTPDTNDQERIEVAKAATKFVHYWWDCEEMDRKSRDIFLNGDVKAYCAAKVYFDGESGKDITPQKGETGYKEGMSPLRTGEIRCRVCDPLTLYIDPAATSDDEIRWIVEEKPRDIDYVFEKYGKKVDPDDTVDYAPSFDITNQGTLGINSVSKKNKNMVMVRELWMKPCKKYPNGLKVAVTRNGFLDKDENAGELPYIIFGDIPIPGTVKYKAFIENMIPIQRGLNIALTMFATNMKKMGATKWTVPIGSNVDEEELNDEISGIIHFNPTNGGKIERIPGAEVPNGFDRIIEYYNRLIDEMSGAREISQGRLPSGLDTLGGLELMVEQENEKLAVNSQNYERGMKKLLKRVLQLMKKHYTEERMGRILGPDNEVELVAFTGSDLSGEEDINITQGSSLPEMKAAQQDRIMTLWQQKAIVMKDGVTPDAPTFLRMMGMGDSTELFEQHQLDENKAKMENKIFDQMPENPQLYQAYTDFEQKKQFATVHNQIMQQQVAANGLPPDEAQNMMEPMPTPPQGIPFVRDFQDHEIHIYNHNVFRKSSAYDELPPEIQALVDAHVQEHEQILQAPIIAQQQQQMAMMDAQGKQAQDQQQAQSQESDKAHQRQMEMKQVDHANNLQKEQMKGNTALQTAAMRTPPGQG